MDRRRLLVALGAGGVLASAGCLGAGDEDNPGTVNEGTDGIDPRFGLTVVAADDSDPVDPDHTVQLLIRGRESAPIPEFYFEPTGLAIEPGETVAFEMATPHHNVNAYHPAFGYTRRVPESTPPFSSPVLGSGDTWYYTFENEGVHDVTCAPHEMFGMAGRIVVGSASGPGSEPVGEAPGEGDARPPEMTAGLVLSDPALEPDAILDSGTVGWDELDPANKRLLIDLGDGEGH